MTSSIQPKDPAGQAQDPGPHIQVAIGRAAEIDLWDSTLDAPNRMQPRHSTSRH